MPRGLFDAILGGVEIAAGIAIDVVSHGTAAAWGNMLIGAGIGTEISGIGQLIQGDPKQGFATLERNSIAPWSISNGRVRTGGKLVYDHEWGNNNNFRDLVIVLNAAPSQIDMDHPVTLLFDQQRVQLDPTAVPKSAAAGYPIPFPNPCSGTSFTPVQQTVNLTSVVRANDVVTFKLADDIPYLIAGDQIIAQNVPGDLTLNGTFQVAEITNAPSSHVGGAVGLGTALWFTVLNGGLAATVTSAGQVRTKWADYGRNVYMEVLNGNQALGDTFIGMTAGTPYQGTGKLGTPASPGSNFGGAAAPNPWSPDTTAGHTPSFCSLQGKTAVFLRIQYMKDYFPSGLPQISFLMYGKSNIYDPRLGNFGAPGTTAYTENAALLIADFLHAGAPNGAPWASGTTYAAGGVASYNGVDYVSFTGANTGNQPDTSTTHWVPVVPSNPITAYNANTTYAKGQIVRYAIPNSQHIDDLGLQYVSIVNSNTGNTPSSSPSQWASLAIEVRQLVDVGYKLNYGSDIPTSPLTTAANVCDQSVTLANGGTEPRYACNGQYELTKLRGAILEDLLTSCAGRISYAGGQYTIQPGYWTGGSPASVNLTSMAAGPYAWKGISIRELFNGVKGTYISPANKWQSTDFPYYAQDAPHGYSGPPQYGGDVNLAVDGGDRRWMELHMLFTISAATAQRIAKIMLLRSRWADLRIGGNGTFPLNMAGYQFAALDIIAATVPFLSFGGKLLEVTSVRFKVDQGKGAPLLGTEIDVRATDSSIYAWSTTEELSAQGYAQSNYPTGTFQEVVPLPWSPGYAPPLAGDAIGGPATFGLEPVYPVDAQGNASAALQVKGTYPINALDTGIEAPLISCVASTSGGSLKPGTYVVGLTAFDSGSANHGNSDYQALAIVEVAGSGSASIAVTVTWGSGDDGGDLYLALWNADQSYVFHQNQTLAPGAGSATITAFTQTTPGGPDPLGDHFGVVFQSVEHSGVWDGQIPTTGSITATTVTITAPTTTLNQYAGYTLSLLGRETPGEVPPINLPIASNTASSGGLVTFTIGAGADGNTLVDLRTILQALDLLVMRGKYTFTSTSCTDPNVANSYFPTGADASVEPGHVGVVMTGADTGDVVTVQSVTADGFGNFTVFNFAAAFQITPATGDLIIFCDPTSTEIPSAAFSARNASTAAVVATPDLANFANQTWLIRVRVKAADESFGPDALAPMRDVYFFGAQGQRTITASATMLPTDGQVNAIITGAATYTCLAFSTVPNQLFVVSNDSTSTANLTVAVHSGDSFNDGATSRVLSPGQSTTFKVNS